MPTILPMKYVLIHARDASTPYSTTREVLATARYNPLIITRQDPPAGRTDPHTMHATDPGWFCMQLVDNCAVLVRRNADNSMERLSITANEQNDILNIYGGSDSAWFDSGKPTKEETKKIPRQLYNALVIPLPENTKTDDAEHMLDALRFDLPKRPRQEDDYEAESRQKKRQRQDSRYYQPRRSSDSHQGKANDDSKTQSVNLSDDLLYKAQTKNPSTPEAYTRPRNQGLQFDTVPVRATATSFDRVVAPTDEDIRDADIHDEDIRDEDGSKPLSMGMRVMQLDTRAKTVLAIAILLLCYTVYCTLCWGIVAALGPQEPVPATEEPVIVTENTCTGPGGVCTETDAPHTGTDLAKPQTYIGWLGTHTLSIFGSTLTQIVYPFAYPFIFLAHSIPFAMPSRPTSAPAHAGNRNTKGKQLKRVPRK